MSDELAHLEIDAGCQQKAILMFVLERRCRALLRVEMQLLASLNPYGHNPLGNRAYLIK